MAKFKKITDSEQRTERAATLLGAAFSLALIYNGWVLHEEPTQFYFQRGADQVAPFLIVGELASGALSAAAWLERAEALDIQDLRLDGLTVALPSENE